MHPLLSLAFRCLCRQSDADILNQSLRFHFHHHPHPCSPLKWACSSAANKLEKTSTSDATVWTQYQSSVPQVGIPEGRERALLLVSNRKRGDPDGSGIWKRGFSGNNHAREIRKEPNDVWLALFPQGKLPLGESLASARPPVSTS